MFASSGPGFVFTSPASENETICGNRVGVVTMTLFRSFDLSGDFCSSFTLCDCVRGGRNSWLASHSVSIPEGETVV